MEAGLFQRVVQRGGAGPHLALLVARNKERALTYVIVTHNFGVMRAIAERWR